MGTKVIEPQGICLTVIKQKATTVTSSGLHIPESHANAFRARAVIVSFGDGMCPDGKIVPMPYKIGDTVILPSHAGVPIDAEGYGKDELLLITKNDIFALERDTDVDEIPTERVSVPA